MIESNLRTSGLMVGIARALRFDTAGKFIEFLRENWNLPELAGKYGEVDPPSVPALYNVPRKHYGPERLKWLIEFAARERKVAFDSESWFRQIDLTVRNPPAELADPVHNRPLTGRAEEWIYCYCYVVQSRMFTEDSGAASTPYTIGYFIVDHSGTMTVPQATTWYYGDDHLAFNPDLKRGKWTSEYVGVSETDILVVYNFEFHPDLRPNWLTYRGLLAGKSKPGLSAIFPPGKAYLGNFYALAANSGYSGPTAGEIYIELYQEGPKAEFNLKDFEDALKRDLRARAVELWGHLGVEPASLLSKRPSGQK